MEDRTVWMFDGLLDDTADREAGELLTRDADCGRHVRITVEVDNSEAHLGALTDRVERSLLRRMRAHGGLAVH